MKGMKRQVGSLLIGIQILIVMTGLILAGCTASNGAGLEIYLVKQGGEDLEGSRGIETLELEPQPLLSREDIVSYHWDWHCIKVKNSGKISPDLLKRQFVVEADGKRVYSGAFWTGLYSMWPPKIAVYLDNLDEKAPGLILALGGWRPLEPIEEKTRGILSDPSVYKVIQRDGLLFQPYKPSYFAYPDSLSVSSEGTVFNYGGADWEKTDALVRVLDARFSKQLDLVKLALKQEDSAALYQEKAMVELGYTKVQMTAYSLIGGRSAEKVYNRILLPLTDDYRDLAFFIDDSGMLTGPIGGLKPLADSELEKILAEAPRHQSSGEMKPKGMNIGYYTGEPFKYPTYRYYSVEEDASRIMQLISRNKRLKKEPEGVQMLPLTINMGDKAETWFYPMSDGQTLFSEGKYYKNHELASLILETAKVGFGFRMFDPTVFKGIVKARYTFRSPVHTYIRETEEPSTLAEMEKGLVKAKHDMGGGCPFADGVLELTFRDGRMLEISMASDGCPLMFVDGNYLKYAPELHKLLRSTFDNFPYVQRRSRD